MSDPAKKVKKDKVKKELDYTKLPYEVWEDIWQREWLDPLNYIEQRLPLVQKALDRLEHQIKVNTQVKDVL